MGNKAGLINFNQAGEDESCLHKNHLPRRGPIKRQTRQKHTLPERGRFLEHPLPCFAISMAWTSKVPTQEDITNHIVLTPTADRVSFLFWNSPRFYSKTRPLSPAFRKRQEKIIRRTRLQTPCFAHKSKNQKKRMWVLYGLKDSYSNHAPRNL